MRLSFKKTKNVTFDPKTKPLKDFLEMILEDQASGV